MLRRESCPHHLQGKFIEIGNSGVGNDLCRPVERECLGTDFVQLVRVEGDQALAGSAVIVPIPSDRHSARGGRNLEEHHPALRMSENVNLAKRNAARAIPYLYLVSLQVFNIFLVTAADHRTAFVVDAEDQPSPRLLAEIGFVGHRRHILTEFPAGEAFPATFELHNLIFPVVDQPVKQVGKGCIIHSHYQSALTSVVGDSWRKICSTLIFTASETKPLSRKTTRRGL